MSKTPIHLESAGREPVSAIPLSGFGYDGESFGRYIDEHCKPGAPGRLLMVESTPSDWPSWECHPEGDEIVIVLEGSGEFLQELDGEVRRSPFEPGSTFINPAGTWHSADVTSPMKAIYLTPCPGTQHRDR